MKKMWKLFKGFSSLINHRLILLKDFILRKMIIIHLFYYLIHLYQFFDNCLRHKFYIYMYMTIIIEESNYKLLKFEFELRF